MLVLPAEEPLDVRDVERGVRMGSEEAARTGELLGRTLELATIHDDSSLAGEIERFGPDGIIGGFSRQGALELASQAKRAGALFLNVGSAADALREADCRANMLHVQASGAMREKALQMYPGQPEAAAVVWHPTLFRYGAAQLNERFERRFSAGMTGPAWSGWFATKALWESSLRTRSTDSKTLAAYLTSPERRFDGHKGWPLSFDHSSGQLRQSLYIVAPTSDGQVVGEAPSPDAPREQLNEFARSAGRCGSRSSEQ